MQQGVEGMKDRETFSAYGDIICVDFHTVVSSSNYYDTPGLSDMLTTHRQICAPFIEKKTNFI